MKHEKRRRGQGRGRTAPRDSTVEQFAVLILGGLALLGFLLL